MGRKYLNQFTENENVDEVLLGGGKQLRPNRSGNLYLQLTLSDKTGSVNAMQWNANQGTYDAFENGDYLRVQGKTQFFNGNLQIIVQKLTVVDAANIDESDFVQLGNEDIGKLLVQLRQFIDSIDNQSLKQLATLYLEDKTLVDKLCKAPAGVKNHHAYHGGLLDHIVHLMRLVDAVVPLYPQVNRDLLLMGVFLHDLSKTTELLFERSFEYSDEGQLIGHLVQGVELLQSKITEFNSTAEQEFPATLALHLKHLIISHHGQYEFGSPKLPMTLEAITLHHLDNLDAKIFAFTNCIEQNQQSNPGDNWTPYQPSLGRKIYRGPIE
jgi:3'-5' exoribonuclease|tara:strand:- start:1624 stop:2598 length:975 start_codon:yes stop_codon:yes gene_type:complete